MGLPIPYGQAFQIALVVVAIVCIVCAVIGLKKDKEDPNRGFWIAIAIMTFITWIFLLITYIWQYSAGWMD